MGSGASKTKNSPTTNGKGGAKVVADVVVPNQSEPVRITGELDGATPTDGSGGQATVKEIGPNKFSLQMGDKTVGTFETTGEGGGDFSSYLANTASLTIKNIETVAEDGDKSKMTDNKNEPLVIQLGEAPTKNYGDDVEWEEVIQDIDGQGSAGKKSGRGIDVTDGAEDRKAQLKEALKSKQAKLSQEEYDQMIANHRQEVELMSLLREKEMERQKFSLASKVAARQRRRKAKKAFTEADGDTKEDEDFNLQSTAKYRELQQQIAIHKAQMEQASEDQKHSVATDNEMEQIMEKHKQSVAELERDLERLKGHKQAELENKLVERKMRRKKRQAEKKEQEKLKAKQEKENAEKEESAKEMQAEIEAKQAAFQREVEAKKEQLSADEYQRLLAKHKAEITELQHRADLQQLRQKQNLQDKLNSRRRRRDGVNAEKVMTAAELQRLEAELRERQVQFESEAKEKRGTVSDEEYRRLMAAHKQELAELQGKLDLQRGRQQQTLLDKLAARRAKQTNNKQEQALIARLESQTVSMKDPDSVSKDPAVAGAMDADEIKELQLAISKKDLEFRQSLAEVKVSRSKADAQRFIDAHRAEMTELQQQLDLEKARMKAALMAKLEARRRKGGANDAVDESEAAMSAEEIKQLQLILDQKAAAFKVHQKTAKKEMSVADYQKFLDAHQQDMEGLEQRLDRERLRMEQSLKDKMAARRFRRPESAASAGGKTADEQSLEEEMRRKEAEFAATVTSKKAQLSADEYERYLKKHREEMAELQRRLDRAKNRQDRNLEDKLAERRRRRQMWKNEEEERMRLMKLLEGKTERLSLDEFNDISEEILNYDEAVMTDIQDKKGKVSDKEHEKMLADHRGHMDKLEQTLIEKGKGKNEEINGIEDEMGHKEALFLANVELNKEDLSQGEYERLLDQHRREMEGLKQRLGRAQGRQEAHLRARLEARRRRRRRMEGNEEEESKRLNEQLAKVDQLSPDELDDLEDDIAFYVSVMSQNIEKKKGLVSQGEYENLKEEHRYRSELMIQTLREERKIDNSQNLGSDESDSEDDTDLVVGMPDLDPGQQVDSTKTSLWTTPTQSNDVVIIPLKEEYPVKRKRELYTDAAIFRAIDAHAIKLAQTVSLVTQPSFSALVSELTEFGTSELQKVRLVFRWLTAQNCEEMDLNDVIDDTPLGVLKGLYHKKITFSTLFMRMCRFIGLQCVEIVGIAKVKGYRAGQFISPKEPEFHHTWNAVRIDGFWHFVDCNWGVSHIAGSVTYDPFRFEYDEHFFLCDPDVIICSHCSNDPAWQLLASPLTLDDFNNQALLKPDFFQFGFGLMSHRSAVIDVPQGDLDIRIHCPPGFILSCRVSTVDTDRDVSASGIPFDLYEFIHQVGDSVMACFVRIPEAGNFYLTLYAKRQYLDGELNIESYTEICRYFIRVHAPSQDTVPLPFSPADHWGPIGTLNAGLVPVTHRSSVAMSTDGSDFDIRFKKTQPLKFSHTLTSYGKDDRQLVPYAMQRTVDDVLAFLVTPPQPGRYGLHIYVHYPGLPNPAHLCSYMLVAHAARPNIPPIPSPEGNIWGPTAAFQSLGLSTFTNPDALITTRDPATEIIIGTSARIFLQHRVTANGRDVSQCATPQFGSGFVTFQLQLPYTGYYYFKLMGKDTDDSSVPATILFNYLIRRD